MKFQPLWMGKVLRSAVQSRMQMRRRSFFETVGTKGEKGEVCWDTCSMVGVNKNGRRGVQNSL